MNHGVKNYLMLDQLIVPKSPMETHIHTIIPLIEIGFIWKFPLLLPMDKIKELVSMTLQVISIHNL
jgi:hypothetical protein